jgi:hypothetical protein
MVGTTGREHHPRKGPGSQMFVRWMKTRKRPAWAQPGVVIRYQSGAAPFQIGAEGFLLYSAQVVEAQRVDGKPRQRVVLHLGSMAEYALSSPLACATFWAQVYDKIADLWVPPTQRQAILGQIAAQVPRPTRGSPVWRDLRHHWYREQQVYRCRTRTGWRLARRRRRHEVWLTWGPSLALSPRQRQTLQVFYSLRHWAGQPVPTGDWRRAARHSGVPVGTFYKAKQALIHKHYVRRVP